MPGWGLVAGAVLEEKQESSAESSSLHVPCPVRRAGTPSVELPGDQPSGARRSGVLGACPACPLLGDRAKGNVLGTPLPPRQGAAAAGKALPCPGGSSSGPGLPFYPCEVGASTGPPQQLGCGRQWHRLPVPRGRNWGLGEGQRRGSGLPGTHHVHPAPGGSSVHRNPAETLGTGRPRVPQCPGSRGRGCSQRPVPARC